MLSRERFKVRFPEPFLIAGDLGRMAQDFNNPRVHLRQQRQKLAPDAVAQKPKVPVACVLTPKLLTAVEPVEHRLPPRLKEGADHTASDDWMDARQAADSRSSQEPMQDGLRLIVRGVPDGDPVRHTGVHQRKKIPVAEAAGSCFEICTSLGGAAPNIGGGTVNRQLETVRKLPDKLLILLGVVSAQLVVEVRNGKGAAQFRGKLLQSQQQGGRIRSSGTGHGNALPGRNQTISPNRFPHLVEHGSVVSLVQFLPKFIIG
jgi:hypothetical protein